MKNWSKLSLEKRKKIFRKARDAYYNKRPIMSDDDFDALEDTIAQEDPNWTDLKKTGAPVKKNKVKLEFYMPSLGKKTPKDVQDFLGRPQAANIMVSKKLDGTSLQLIYENGVPIHCYTRGRADPTKDTHSQWGGDVSYLVPHLKIPKKISFKKHLVLRCEGIFRRAKFQKYKNEFDNPRNAASGIMNRASDKVHPATRDLDLVVVKMLNPWVVPSAGLKAAKRLGFRVVGFKSVPVKKITTEKLVRTLEKAKSKSKYQMDGLVLTWDKINPKYTADKPTWEIAFKVPQGEETAPVATVRKIVWKVSSFGVLVPKAILDPVRFDGVTVKQATLNNARWMVDRGIGPGAQVKLIRGGEIIPKIIGVVRKGKVQLPDKSEFGAYGWDDNDTHLVLKDRDASEDVRIRGIVRFFSKLGVDFMKESTVRRMYDIGLDSVKKILRAEPDDFMKMEGVKEKTANKLYDAIQRFVSEGGFLPRLMEASGCFPKGLGAKRIAQIQKKHPDLLGLADLSKSEIRDALEDVPMFSGTTIEMFVDGIYKFKRFFDSTGLKIKKPTKIKKDSNKLDGLSVTWTGYRSKEQEDLVTKNGGNVVSFGGGTDVLLISPVGKTSSKPDKARARGIPVMYWEQFQKKYGI